jgi:hypothetical protein
MKSQTKIQLSTVEMELVNNADWILTKNAIIQKAKWLFETLQAEQEKYLQPYTNRFSPEIFKLLPKISKGENYKGLPYLMLDYPRCFTRENIWAIRTMFWWGNFFSITLHLSGKYKKHYEQKIISSYPLLKKGDYYICTGDNEWEHHFEKNNFMHIQESGKPLFQTLIKKKSFIKLSQKIPLHQWVNAKKILFEDFKKICELLVS